MNTYFAHSGNDQGFWNPLRVHLKGVAERARRFAEVFGAGDAAHLLGLLHDLGKYGDLFQERLKGLESGLDHWSMGASVCLDRYRNSETAMAVQGHHLGLQWWEKEELRRGLKRLRHGLLVVGCGSPPARAAWIETNNGYCNAGGLRKCGRRWLPNP